METKKELEEKRLEDYHILSKDEERKFGGFRQQRLFVRCLGLFFFICPLILIYTMLTEGHKDGSCYEWGNLTLGIFLVVLMFFGLLLIIASLLQTIIPKNEYKKRQRANTNEESYLIDGVPACDDDFRDAIMEINEAPEVITFSIEGSPDITVAPIKEGKEGISLLRDKEDGSCWATETQMSAEVACEYVKKYLASDTSWISELQWEQIELPKREASIRFLIVLVVGVILVLLAKWLLKIG